MPISQFTLPLAADEGGGAGALRLEVAGGRAPVPIESEMSLAREIAAFRDLVVTDTLGLANIDLGIAVTKVLEAAELSLQLGEAKIVVDTHRSN